MDLTPAGAGETVDAAREQYLTLLLDRFESGSLEAYEYTRRVKALEMATTVDQMADIVSSAPRPEAPLDPVDLMALSRSSSTMPAQERRVKWVWPVIVGVFLLVLMGVGLWLVAHTKAIQSHGTGVVTGALLVAAASAAAAIGSVVA